MPYAAFSLIMPTIKIPTQINKGIKMMAKNITYQMTSAIENGFRPGMDKHSDKRKNNNESTYKIYSYASRNEMVDFAHRFGKFIKENYPEIRQVKNIGIEQVNSYLASKGNVTQKTIEHEVACLNKLSLCVNKKFGISTDFKTGRVVPVMEVARKRDVVFTKEQVKGLNDYFDTKKDCHSKNAFYIGERFALRASEITKLQYRDIDWENKKLHIVDSKGKRSRAIDITKDDIVFLRKITQGLSGKDKLIPLKPDSVCAYLNRACKHLGYDNIVKAKTSYHALRKYSISVKMKEKEKELGSKSAATKYCMDYLGHGKNRGDLQSVYLHNIE